jgi:hypothetical protein
MRLRFLFVVWLVCGSIAAVQDGPKPHVRFFNDSAKAVYIYVEVKWAALFRQTPKKTMRTVTPKSVQANTT